MSCVLCGCGKPKVVYLDTENYWLYFMLTMTYEAVYIDGEYQGYSSVYLTSRTKDDACEFIGVYVLADASGLDSLDQRLDTPFDGGYAISVDKSGNSEKTFVGYADTTNAIDAYYSQRDSEVLKYQDKMVTYVGGRVKCEV